MTTERGKQYDISELQKLQKGDRGLFESIAPIGLENTYGFIIKGIKIQPDLAKYLGFDLSEGSRPTFDYIDTTPRELLNEAPDENYPNRVVGLLQSEPTQLNPNFSPQLYTFKNFLDMMFARQNAFLKKRFLQTITADKTRPFLVIFGHSLVDNRGWIIGEAGNLNGVEVGQLLKHAHAEQYSAVLLITCKPKLEGVPDPVPGTEVYYAEGPTGLMHEHVACVLAANQS